MKTSCEYLGESASLLGRTGEEWFSSQLDLLCESLELVNLVHPKHAVKTTEFIRQSLKEPLSSWSTKVLFTSALPPVRAASNYKIDYQLRSSNQDPKTKRLISLELVFDNRQAIGTNLLKLESAARQFALDTGGFSLSVIVAPSQQLKNRGFWDSSVATDAEYSWAVRNAYSSLLTSPLALISLS